MLTVGIGASAGGLEAYRKFFARMPADSGMAFVLVQHLDPAHVSILPDILSASTAMAVSHASSGDRLAPNRVFVIPPDATLKLAGGRLEITTPADPAVRRASVDTFLTSLAEDQREDAVGIILSGFGSDGARGVEAIKEHGGLTISEAEFDHAPKPGMPKSAAERGFVDHVLPIDKMPATLLEYARFRAKTDGARGQEGFHSDVASQLGAICAILNSRLGRDFSLYKPNTLLRRIQRRMQVLQIADVAGYVEQLRERADEPELLFREILIRVTQFFRDRPAFEALASHIPRLLAAGEPADPIRIWAPGCATGEEAYSLAILFKEAMVLADRPRKVLIFATDVDEQAIDVARAGFYSQTIAAEVGEDQLARHFTKELDRYRVSKDLRQMCLFSTHDLVRDPPFSKLDLISCRNVMIYFGAALQKRVVTMFHYGLRPGGLLFLGSSEAVTNHARLFSPVDKKHRLFERRDGPRQVAGARAPPARPPAPPRSASRDANGDADPRVARLMSRYVPAHAVIDRGHAVLRFSGPILKVLDPAIDSSGMKLPGLVQPALREPLRAALKRVAATGRGSVEEGLVFEADCGRHAVNLIVEPLPARDAADEGGFIVAFQDLGTPRAPEPVETLAPSEGEQLSDLVVARERLQALTEELETANEELQSSNEEYQSVNEELQSLNEELETSKEELQSINEELGTVIAELNVRNETLVDVNSDLKNLIDSTSIATLFLDQDLRIKRFTPALLEIFSVREGDEGRPITDIVSHLARDGLRRDAEGVFRTLIPVAREVSLADGARVFQMIIRPYRDLNNAIGGVVVTFVDITERKRGERDRAKLAAIVDSSVDAIIGHDLDGVITSWNAAAEAIYGYAPEEALGMPMSALLNEAQRDEWPALLARLVGGEPVRHFDSTRRTKDGREVAVSMTLSPIRAPDGQVAGVSAVARDITERKQAERRAQLLLSELDHRVKNILAVVSSVTSQTLRSARDPEEFVEAIESRIRAIAKAHNLLARDGGRGASLREIFETETAPYGDETNRISLAGPQIVLTPKAGFSLAMATHELTTNAAKHGSLSVAEGRLRVGWAVSAPDGRSTLEIVWAEAGGPRVRQPTRRGFGSTLIERTLAYEFDATVDRRFEPAGLRCAITVPLTEEFGHLVAPAAVASPG